MVIPTNGYKPALRSPNDNLTAMERQQLQAGLGDITILQQGVTYTSLRSEGLSLDGTTDETAAFRTVIDNASAGTVLVLDERAHLRLSEQITWTGKRLELLGFGGAVVESTAIINAPLLYIVNSDDVRIGGFRMQGAETVYANTSTTNHFALQLIGGDRADVHDIAIAGFSRGASVDTSDYARIDNLSYDGLITAHETWAQFHNTLRIIGSNHVEVSRIAGRNCGSAVLVGSTSRHGKIWGVDAINCWDNGVYVSSGFGWDVSAVNAVMTATMTQTNTGVKMRGSHNSVHHCKVDGYGTGFVLTGSTATLDADGANGSGSEIDTVRAINTAYHGAIIEDDDIADPRDFAILNSIFDGCGTAGGAYQSVKVTNGNYHRIIGNVVQNQVGTAAGYLIQGASGALPLTNLTVALNKTRDLASNSAALGMQVTWVDDSLFAFNEFNNVPGAPYAIRFFEADRNTTTGTKKFGTAGTSATIRVHDAGSTSNLIYDNPQATISDTGTTTTKYGNSNGNPSVTGSRGGNAALASLLTALAGDKLVTDNTTA